MHRLPDNHTMPDSLARTTEGHEKCGSPFRRHIRARGRNAVPLCPRWGRYAGCGRSHRRWWHGFLILLPVHDVTHREAARLLRFFLLEIPILAEWVVDS